MNFGNMPWINLVPDYGMQKVTIGRIFYVIGVLLKPQKCVGCKSIA